MLMKESFSRKVVVPKRSNYFVVIHYAGNSSSLLHGSISRSSSSVVEVLHLSTQSCQADCYQSSNRTYSFDAGDVFINLTTSVPILIVSYC